MRRVGGAATVQWRCITFTFETRIDYSSSVGKTETFVIMTTHDHVTDNLGKEEVLGQVAAFSWVRESAAVLYLWFICYLLLFSFPYLLILARTTSLEYAKPQ